MSLGTMLKTDLVKTLSALFLFTVVMAALAIAVYDKFAGMPIDSTVQTVLTSAVLLALANIGVNHGLAIANGIAKETAVAVVQTVQQNGSRSDAGPGQA